MEEQRQENQNNPQLPSSNNTSNNSDQKQKNNHGSLFLTVVMFGFFSGFFGAIAAIYTLGGELNLAKDPKEIQTKVLLQEGEIIADVAEKLSPSVVSINTSSTATNAFGASRSQQGAGTGVVVNDSGMIVTNKHVVPANTTDIVITDSDGKSYENVTVIDRDPVNDVAFLQIKDQNDLKPAKLGNSSELKAGNRVIAIGNALGLFSNTVTSGIVSGVGRPVTASSGNSSETLDNLIQTDASINPGNSGGPLVNIEGEVIGINTAIAGDAENIGFAIPIDDIKPLFASVTKNGEIIRAYLGVRFVPVTDAIVEEFDLKTNSGALIVASQDLPAVLPNSPADKADIRPGDVIKQVGETKVDETTNLSSVISKYEVGEKVEIRLNRDGRDISKTVTLEKSEF